jgi:hypothetical protein
VQIAPIGQLILDIQYLPNSNNEATALLQVNSDAGLFIDTLQGQGTISVNGLITFQRIIGTQEDDNSGRYIETQDGGYALAGSTTKPDEVYTDIYVVRTDKYGKVLWSNTYGGQYDDAGIDMVQTADGGFVVLAASNSYGNGQQVIYLLRLDSQGAKLWDKTISESKDISPSNILKTSDQGFIISGNTKDTPDNSTDALLIKTDSTGNVIWKKHYGGSDGESASDVIMTSDGGYIMTGSIAYSSNGDFDVYVVKTDSAGNQQWSKTYGGSGWDGGSKIISTSDNGYLISGYTVSYGAGGEDGYLVKIDDSGNKQWDNYFGDVHNDAFNSAVQTADDGYIAAGSTVNYFSQQNSQTRIYTDVYIVRVDKSGSFVWSRQYGGNKSDSGGLILKDSDGAYSILGSTESYGQSRDLYFLKLNGEGLLTNILENSNKTEPSKFTLEQNYPNPFNPATKIRFSIPDGMGAQKISLNVYNVLGQKIAELIDAHLKPGNYSTIFEGNQLASGIYFYSLHAGNFSITKKMVLTK